MADYTERYMQLRQHILELHAEIQRYHSEKLEAGTACKASQKDTPQYTFLLRRFAHAKSALEQRQNLLNQTVQVLYSEYIQGVKGKVYVKSDSIISGLKELKALSTLP